MTNMTDTTGSDAAAAVRPGDTLVVGVGNLVRADQAVELKNKLQAQLGVDVVVITGANALATVRKT